MVDLDYFKTINDTMGHAEGDRVLRMSAMALKLLHREGDKVYRLGGDEFATIMPLYEPGEGNSIPDDGMFAERLKQRFLSEVHLIREGRYKAALMLHGLELSDLDKQALDILGASFGVVTELGSVVNYNEMLARADALMFVMKNSRPNKR
jgi:diguanylate cyclase (GGDEF)-like protein